MNKCNFHITSSLVFTGLIRLCVELSVPFHYDPSSKYFECYPVCQEDVSKFYGLFNPNSNR